MYIDLVFDDRHGIALEVFADESHAVHDDTKGNREAIALISTASVHISSIKQKVMSRSSFEAELNGLYEIIPQMIGPQGSWCHRGTVCVCR